MENKENITMTNNTNTYKFPEVLQPDLDQCVELYTIIKHNLAEFDRAWVTKPNRHSLIIDFKKGIVELITFLTVMSGSPTEFPFYIADRLFENEPDEKFPSLFKSTAEKLGLDDLLFNYDITPQVIEKFNSFTNRLADILEILPVFGDNNELSMIYYVYSALIAGICQLLEKNSAITIIYTGINNYLNTQFKFIRLHMSNPDIEQFDNSVFPYLKNMGRRIDELSSSAGIK